MKLRRYLFLSLTLIAIVPQIVLTGILLYFHNKTMNTRISEIVDHQFSNIVQSVSDTYDAVENAFAVLTFYSDDSRSIINILAKYADADRPLSNYEVYQASTEMKSICQTVCYTYSFIEAVYVFTPAGTIISHTTLPYGNIPSEYNPIGEEWYQRTLELAGKPYTSPLGVYAMFDDQKERFFVAKSIRDIYTHQELGVIFLDCNADMFNLEGVNALGKMASITLRDTGSGAVLCTGGSTDTAAASSREMSATLTDVPVEISLSFDYHSLASSFKISTIVLLLVSTACEIMIVWFTYRISGKIIRPIVQLSDIVLRQRSIDFVPFTEYADRRDEIGTLFRAYNEMMEQLNVAVKEKYENQLLALDAQMRALEANINSHFLFNTLESINSMAELSDNEPIATMSMALGNMFRYAVKTESEQVTLREELKNVRDYTSIQRIRFNNRFRLSVSVPEALMEQKMLKLILQPLVENALSHGLDYCTRGDEIDIRAREEDRLLVIDVADNGQGIPADQLAEIRNVLALEASFSELGHRTRQHIGLKNIQSRVELYYGKGYGLTIRSEAGGGTDIQIRLPIL